MIQLQTGDRILVNSSSFLSRAIRYFMRIYARKYHKPTDFIFSHAGTIIILNGIPFVAESIANGYRVTKLDLHYDMDKDDMVIIRNKEPYTFEERHEAFIYAMYLQEVNNFYQYWAFIQWISLIVFGVNIFGKGNKFSTYCYEATYRIAKKLRPHEFPINPEVVTCFDLITEHDEIVYDNHVKK